MMASLLLLLHAPSPIPIERVKMRLNTVKREMYGFV
jgi:hypothetical protein